MPEKNSFEQIIASQYEALGRKNNDEEKLKSFTPEERDLILRRKRILSSTVYFIGKDFNMPVELNDPGAGWHWDFKENIVRTDPKDLLEKPESFSRFVMGHEAGHRRISRTGFIPEETWKQPGFAFLMNAVEDPRDNNFVAEGYPQFKEDLDSGYEWVEQMERQSSEKAQSKLGYQPRFKQAGYEYIKQWYREVSGQEENISEGLSEEVKGAVKKTLESARDAWWTYPSKKEADESEENIIKYAYSSYKVINEKIWPEIQKLIEKDMEDQKMQEFMKDMEKDKMEQGSGDGGGLPQEMKDKLTPEEQEELEKAIEEAIEKAKQDVQKGSTPSLESAGRQEHGANEEGEKGSETEVEGSAGDGSPEEKEGEGGGKPMPIDMDSLSEGLKKKIKDFIEGLPEDKKKELGEKAEKELGEFSKEVADDLQGKMTENPEQKAERERKESSEEKDNRDKTVISGGAPVRAGKLRKEPIEIEGLKIYKERLLREINKDKNIYEKYRREVLPIIDKLENDLREIFIKRRAGQWESGFKYGKRMDIGKRIQEKARGVSAVESKAWQKKEIPGERDYAVTILVDLSGSMRRNKKIEETFKAVIVLTEVLNRLGINLEVVGFNDDIYEYQNFGRPMSNEIREHMGGMFKEVEDSSCKSCGDEHNETDLGWATEVASERLAKQKNKNKFLIVLTDGKLAESSNHPRSKYNSSEIVNKNIEKTDIHFASIGVGQGSEQLKSIFPNSFTSPNVQEMAGKLADLIRDVVVNYDKF